MTISHPRRRFCIAYNPPLLVLRRSLSVLLLSFVTATSYADRVNAQEESYPTPAEALKVEGVPEGQIHGPTVFESKIFPGTVREYWVYEPAQYDPEKPACSMIVQDGLKRAEGWKLPAVCDNLIHQKEMPVTIGIFVSPGVVPATKKDSQPRYNRSFEYDSLGDRYARFLLEELIPHVSQSYNLSTDPNDRMLAGSSSGGICAFNAAWQRPDAFRRVFSTIGTYVGLRGANELPVLIRKTEPRPIRVFLQDGSNDNNLYAGSWWVANQDMLSALSWAGYDVKHVWGEGGHNAKHGAAILPDALRWLWRDYPEPLQAAPHDEHRRRTEILLADERWQQVSSGHELAVSPACNAAGELFFCDPRGGRIYRVGDDGKTRVFAQQAGPITTMTFGPDGNLYACREGKNIVRFDPQGQESVVLKDEVRCASLVAMPEGIYFSDRTTPAIWHVGYDGSLKKAMALTAPVTAMAPTVDHAFMHMVMKDQQYTLHARIADDSLLEHRQRYGHLHMPYLDGDSGAEAIAFDTEGRCFIATVRGLQVLDQLGRVHFIIAGPGPSAVTGLAFGGTAKDWLYATSGGSVFRRRLNTTGSPTSAPPIQPPKPNL